MAETINLAVIGLSQQGLEHLDALRHIDGINVLAVCDRNSTTFGPALKSWPDARTFDDMKSAMKVEGLHGVLLVLPHELHLPAVQIAAAESLHIWKEKPLGRTVSEAIRMREIADEARVHLLNGVQRRLHHSYRSLREYLRPKLELGAVRAASIEMTVVGRHTGTPDIENWRSDISQAGGGVLADLGYHALDLAQFLLGPLEHISTTLAKNGIPCSGQAGETDAWVAARAGDVWVRLHVARTTQKLERIRIECDEGVITANRSSVVLHLADGTETKISSGETGWEDAQRAQLQDFVDLIRGAGPKSIGVSTAPRDVLAVSRFMDACYSDAQNLGGLNER